MEFPLTYHRLSSAELKMFYMCISLESFHLNMLWYSKLSQVQKQIASQRLLQLIELFHSS